MADTCKHLVNIRVPLNTENFFDYVSDCWLSTNKNRYCRCICRYYYPGILSFCLSLHSYLLKTNGHSYTNIYG